MQQPLLDFGVPAALFLLMLISGTEIRKEAFFFGKEYRGSLVRGVVIQLILSPLLALMFLKIFNPDPRLASCVVILILCPGGGISNYYTYLAKSNVLLSASITSIGTVLSLVTVPIWHLTLGDSHRNYHPQAALPQLHLGFLESFHIARLALEIFGSKVFGEI